MAARPLPAKRRDRERRSGKAEAVRAEAAAPLVENGERDGSKCPARRSGLLASLPANLLAAVKRIVGQGTSGSQVKGPRADWHSLPGPFEPESFCHLPRVN